MYKSLSEELEIMSLKSNLESIQLLLVLSRSQMLTSVRYIYFTYAIIDTM
jgi:hypothetical protein